MDYMDLEQALCKPVAMLNCLQRFLEISIGEEEMIDVSGLADLISKVKHDIDGIRESLSSQINATLFRIAQEAINNVVRHSQATSTEISLFHEGDFVVLEVKDNGQGFDPSIVREQALASHHFGILGMQERAELVGGSIQLVSEPESGTQVHIQVPCVRNGDRE